MIRVFQSLIQENESDLVIKLGLLLIPEMINYLSIEYVPEAKNMYRHIEKEIYKLKTHNFSYYKYYDVIYKSKSTSILDYRLSQYLLWEVIEDYNLKRYSFLDYEKIIPMVFSNLLGLSFYINKKEIKNVYSFYLENKKLIDSFQKNSYKIKNNLVLANLLVTFESSDNSHNFNEITNLHICDINYAGILFYEGSYTEAKRILNKVLKEQEQDDFYTFFCNYNSCLIDLFSNDYDTKTNENINNLIIPSLFTDEKIISEFQKRIIKIKEISKLKKTSKIDLTTIDSYFKNSNKINIPLFSKAWLFSDYQYWS